MRNNEKDNHELDIDLLLRDAAAEENKALPLDDWKRRLLEKVESGEEEIPVADELAARRRSKLRKWTVGISTVAAALLIVVGTSELFQSNGMNEKSAVPQEARIAAEQGPMDQALPEASLYAMPEAPMAAQDAPAAPSALEAPAPAVESAPPTVGTGDTAGSAGQANLFGMEQALTPEQQQAIDALNAALPAERGKADPATAVVLQLDNVTVTVHPLSGGEEQEVTRALVYQIMVVSDTGEMASYVVDASNYEVLGEIVEGVSE